MFLNICAKLMWLSASLLAIVVNASDSDITIAYKENMINSLEYTNERVKIVIKHKNDKRKKDIIIDTDMPTLIRWIQPGISDENLRKLSQGIGPFPMITGEEMDQLLNQISDFPHYESTWSQEVEHFLGQNGTKVTAGIISGCQMISAYLETSPERKMAAGTMAIGAGVVACSETLRGKFMGLCFFTAGVLGQTYFLYNLIYNSCPTDQAS